MELEKLQRYRNKEGVYTLFNNEEIVYIGYSRNVYVRILEHIVDSKKIFNRIMSFSSSHLSEEDALIMEMLLICKYSPEYNIVKFSSFKMWFNSLPSVHKKLDFYNQISLKVIEEIEDSDNEMAVFI